MDQITSHLIAHFGKSNSEIVGILAEIGIETSSDIVRCRRNRLKKKYGQDLENLGLLERECLSRGIDVNDIASAWIKDKGVSLQLVPKAQVNEGNFEAFLDKIKKYAPKYPVFKRAKLKEPHLFVYAPADIHFGKYTRPDETGQEYNLTVAANRVLDGTDGILQKVSSYQLEKIILVGGNDILHIDNPRNTTTSGTYQDTIGLWWELVELAQETFVKIIETLVPIAKTKVIWVPSNHDFTLGWTVGKILEAWFRGNPDVEFDCRVNHRKYERYGANLLGFSHGDGLKMDDLPLTMANESPDWSATRFRYIYLGHIHHKERFKWRDGKDYVGVSVEYLRTPSASARWEYTNFGSPPKAVEGFVHHPEFGQVSRHTHYF